MVANGTMTNGGTPSAKQKAANEMYTIGHAILEPAIHHESFERLWETKWKAPVSCCLSLVLSILDTDRAFLVYDGSLSIHVRFCQGL